MPFPNETLKKALAELELLPADRLEAAFHDAEERGIPLSDYLVERNVISDENMGRLLTDIPGLAYVNLRSQPIPEEALKILPIEMARHSRMLPFRLEDGLVHVAVNDLDDLEAVAALRKKLRGKRVQLHYATRVGIAMAVARHRKDIATVFQGMLAASDPSIPAIVDTLLVYACQAYASGVQIEPHEKEVMVRFRIDGTMHDIVRYPIGLHDQVITRLKAMARLRTDEKLAAQDGKFREILEGETVDVRLSVVPVIEGEKAVMRLLTERDRHLELESIGLSSAQVETVRRALRKPFGLIMAAGPAGSGKTATLYAMLKTLNASQLDVTTIEDPIEYDLRGVSQIQVDPKTGISFAAGLRAIDQEPDVVMIGEIRDEETAGIAVKEAMSEHLVLTSLAAADAADALTQLQALRVEPLQAASSVALVTAQRLVRKICPHCVRSATLDLADARKGGLPDELARRLFGKRKQIIGYIGAKCGLCRFTGYQGRVGLFELLEVNEPIRALLMRSAGAAEIQAEAARQGMTTMLEDGIQKALDGLTTLDEVLRAMREGN